MGQFAQAPRGIPQALLSPVLLLSSTSPSLLLKNKFKKIKHKERRNFLADSIAEAWKAFPTAGALLTADRAWQG